MPSNGYRRHSADEQRKRRTMRWIIEAIVCVVLITAAFLVSLNVPQIIRTKLAEKVKLQPNSEGFRTWLDPPIDTVRSYYLFNITNPSELVTNPKKTTLKVQDTPPYTYKVKTIKYNTTWLENNTRLDYKVERIITRDPERFNPASENDVGNFIDSIRASIRTKYERIADSSFFALTGMDTFPTGKPVEILEGFTSPVFELARKEMVGPNTDKSGFVYRQNGSGLYSVSIETEGAKKGQVKSFSSNLVDFNISSSSHYPFPVYDSLTYPPELFDKPKIYIFHADFCRPVLLEFTNHVHNIDGIDAHEYRVKFIDTDPHANASNITAYHEVQTLDVTKCISAKLDKPILMLSKAHFYGSSNESVAEMNIEGLNPSRDQHDSVVFFEPHTGTPLKALFRMQMNVNAMIDPMKISADGAGLEPTKSRSHDRVVPLFWIDQDIRLSASKVRTLRIALTLMRHGKWLLPASAVLISVLVVVIVELVACRGQKQSRRGYVKADT